MNATDYEKAVATPQIPDQPPAYLSVPIYNVLKRIIEKRTEVYQTSVAQDRTLLSDSNVIGPRRMAIEIRLGEKEILATAAQEIDKRLAKLLEAKADSESTKNAKKRKL